jgi:hypothetical protein
MRPMAEGLEEMVLNRTWRPALSVTGAEGLPLPANAGNVLRPRTSLALSLRIPPTVNGEKAAARLKEILEADPPYGARVGFEAGQAMQRPQSISASRRCGWARAARSRSWRCWARSSRRRSS